MTEIYFICFAVLKWVLINFLVIFQYKTERDGIVETRVEQKITIQSDGDPIDHDKALAEAIQVCFTTINNQFACKMRLQF